MAPSYQQKTAKIGEIHGTVNLGFKRPVHEGYIGTARRYLVLVKLCLWEWCIMALHTEICCGQGTAASLPCKSCVAGGKKITCTVIPTLPCIFCRGPEEDTGHLRILCERAEAIARLLCVKVEDFTADLPLADTAMEFMSWKQHGCKCTESLMPRVVPGELKRLYAAVSAASS